MFTLDVHSDAGTEKKQKNKLSHPFVSAKVKARMFKKYRFCYDAPAE